MPYAAIAANKRQIQKRHEKFIVARGSRDSDIWSGTSSNGSQMSESNHARDFHRMPPPSGGRSVVGSRAAQMKRTGCFWVIRSKMSKATEYTANDLLDCI
jgi:hypothetical protein